MEQKPSSSSYRSSHIVSNLQKVINNNSSRSGSANGGGGGGGGVPFLAFDIESDCVTDGTLEQCQKQAGPMQTSLQASRTLYNIFL